MELDEAVGVTLRRLRHRNLWSLRQVSSKCSVSLGHLSDAERLKKSPSLHTVEVIANRGLGIDTVVFLKELITTIEGEINE
jgi:transcriptional regulator with XRE-family HTH domain